MTGAGVESVTAPPARDEAASSDRDDHGEPDDDAGRPATRARRSRPATSLPALLLALRGDLADGHYSPRERLIEADLVARYRTTRAAAREALIQLASEKLVERLPNRGARVRAMSVDEAIEIAEVRRLLEVMCAGRAAANGTPAQRRRIEGLARSLRVAIDAGNVDDYLTRNRMFHLTIYEMAGHETARHILEQFQNRPIDRFLPRAFRATPPEASMQEHERIADAIVRGVAPDAERAMLEHLESLIGTLEGFRRRLAAR